MTILTRPLLVGTRGSALARWQTDWVLTRLAAASPGLEHQTKLFTTSGDKILNKALPEIGGKGLFTEELENALRSGEIDLAVHSLKDLPIGDAPGVTIGAICEREDARDVLVAREGYTFRALPPTARVGTSSLRRAAQLLAARPDLTVLPIRGNVDTRLRKAMGGEYDALVLAAAGVLRLGLQNHITEYLPFEVMLPAPGQAALAVQCRVNDESTRELLGALDHPATRSAVTTERAFLQALGSGCSAPVAAYAESKNSKSKFQSPNSPLQISNANAPIVLTGLVAAVDGRRVIRVSGEGDDPFALGAALAEKAIAQGAGALLK
ncbi:MAG: hydroxymethylbilane synthase [Anaerolineales bacterium]